MTRAKREQLERVVSESMPAEADGDAGADARIEGDDAEREIEADAAPAPAPAPPVVSEKQLEAERAALVRSVTGLEPFLSLSHERIIAGCAGALAHLVARCPWASSAFVRRQLFPKMLLLLDADAELDPRTCAAVGATISALCANERVTLRNEPFLQLLMCVRSPSVFSASADAERYLGHALVAVAARYVDRPQSKQAISAVVALMQWEGLGKEGMRALACTLWLLARQCRAPADHAPFVQCDALGILLIAARHHHKMAETAQIQRRSTATPVQPEAGDDASDDEREDETAIDQGVAAWALAAVHALACDAAVMRELDGLAIPLPPSSAASLSADETPVTMAKHVKNAIAAMSKGSRGKRAMSADRMLIELAESHDDCVSTQALALLRTVTFRHWSPETEPRNESADTAPGSAGNFIVPLELTICPNTTIAPLLRIARGRPRNRLEEAGEPPEPEPLEGAQPHVPLASRSILALQVLRVLLAQGIAAHEEATRCAHERAMLNEILRAYREDNLRSLADRNATPEEITAKERELSFAEAKASDALEVALKGQHRATRRARIRCGTIVALDEVLAQFVAAPMDSSTAACAATRTALAAAGVGADSTRTWGMHAPDGSQRSGWWLRSHLQQDREPDDRLMDPESPTRNQGTDPSGVIATAKNPRLLPEAAVLQLDRDIKQLVVTHFLPHDSPAMQKYGARVIAELALERHARAALCEMAAVDAVIDVLSEPASVRAAQAALHALLNLSMHGRAQRTIVSLAMPLLISLRDRPPTHQMGSHVLGVLANISSAPGVRVQLYQHQLSHARVTAVNKAELELSQSLPSLPQLSRDERPQTSHKSRALPSVLTMSQPTTSSRFVQWMQSLATEASPAEGLANDSAAEAQSSVARPRTAQRMQFESTSLSDVLHLLDDSVEEDGASAALGESRPSTSGGMTEAAHLQMRRGLNTNFYANVQSMVKQPMSAMWQQRDMTDIDMHRSLSRPHTSSGASAQVLTMPSSGEISAPMAIEEQLMRSSIASSWHWDLHPEGAIEKIEQHGDHVESNVSMSVMRRLPMSEGRQHVLFKTPPGKVLKGHLKDLLARTPNAEGGRRRQRAPEKEKAETQNAPTEAEGAEAPPDSEKLAASTDNPATGVPDGKEAAGKTSSALLPGAGSRLGDSDSAPGAPGGSRLYRPVGAAIGAQGAEAMSSGRAARERLRIAAARAVALQTVGDFSQSQSEATLQRVSSAKAAMPPPDAPSTAEEQAAREEDQLLRVMRCGLLGGASTRDNADGLMKHNHYKAEIGSRLHVQKGNVHNSQLRKERESDDLSKLLASTSGNGKKKKKRPSLVQATPATRMAMWPSVDGARYANGLLPPPVMMPDGTRAHLYHHALCHASTVEPRAANNVGRPLLLRDRSPYDDDDDDDEDDDAVLHGDFTGVMASAEVIGALLPLPPEPELTPRHARRRWFQLGIGWSSMCFNAVRGGMLPMDELPLALALPVQRDDAAIELDVFEKAVGTSTPPDLSACTLLVHPGCGPGRLFEEPLELILSERNDDLAIPGKSANRVWDARVSSVWAPRVQLADAKDMYDTDGVAARQFEKDWSRLQGSELFAKFVQKQCADKNQREGALARLKAVLSAHARSLSFVFMMFSASAADKNDVSMMRSAEFNILWKWAGLIDESSKRCKQSDFDSILIVTDASDDVEEGGASSAKDGVLMRFEFLEAFVRIAVQRFVRESMECNEAATACEKLIATLATALEEHRGIGDEAHAATVANLRQSQRERATLPLCWDDKRNEWRKRYLYNKGCDDMVRAHLARLEKLYKKNISRDRAKSRLWTLDVWIKVLEQIDFFDQTFTYQQACYCFCMAKMTVVDEVYSRDKHCNLTYVDFLEAICRLAEFKTLPNEEELEEYHVTNVVDLIDALQESECTWGQWLLARPSPESRDLGPLDHRVEQLLIWMFYLLEKGNVRDPEKLLLKLLAATGREKEAKGKKLTRSKSMNKGKPKK